MAPLSIYVGVTFRISSPLLPPLRIIVPPLGHGSFVHFITNFDDPLSEFLQFIIRHYGKALEFGNKYIYQCMPRMLTLWLDFGSSVPDSAAASE